MAKGEWAVRTVWIVSALLGGLFLLSIYHQPVGWGPRLIVTALALGAAFRPYDALIALAGLGPLAAALYGLTRTDAVGLNFPEALTLAFLTGFSARRAAKPRLLAIPAPIGWSATILLAIAFTSGVVEASIITTESFDSGVARLVASFAAGYLVNSNALSATMLFLEGIVLMLFVADIWAGNVNRRHGILRIMVFGASVAALFNVLEILTSALHHTDWWQTFLTFVATLRVNVHFADLNAAGSYFALMLFVAIGFAKTARAGAIGASIALGAAVWIAGSRAALGAAVVVLAASCVSSVCSSRYRRAFPLAVMAIVALIALAGLKWYPQGRNLGSSDALSYRIMMGRAAVNLMAAHPLEGVGLGGFYKRSGQLENAHNNFLQIGAELGLPALVLFVAIVVFALWQLWKSSTGPPWTSPAAGLLAGLVAFLLTCILGHPLLVREAAYPFWIAVGLAIATDSRVSFGSVARRSAILALFVIVAALPFRVSAAIGEANLEHSSAGFSAWQRLADGTRYRWAGGRSSFFVESNARAVRIPLRRGSKAPATVQVRIFLDGVEADRVVLRQDNDSRMVRLVLARRTQARFSRIDLESSVPGDLQPLTVGPTPSAGVLMVGRPIVEP